MANTGEYLLEKLKEYSREKCGLSDKTQSVGVLRLSGGVMLFSLGLSPKHARCGVPPAVALLGRAVILHEHLVPETMLLASCSHAADSFEVCEPDGLSIELLYDFAPELSICLGKDKALFQIGIKELLPFRYRRN